MSFGCLIKEIAGVPLSVSGGVGPGAEWTTGFFRPQWHGQIQLDTIWFVRECFISGVERAAGRREHGIGVRWHGAEATDPVQIKLETARASYQISFGYAGNRFEPYAGEILWEGQRKLLRRAVGADQADLLDESERVTRQIQLRDPAKPAFLAGVDLGLDQPGAIEMDRLLHQISHYHSRSFNFHHLKTRGSDTGPRDRLKDRGDNLWSVLRNLHNKQALDDRYSKILFYMRQAFPEFKDMGFEESFSGQVIGFFVEKHWRSPIYASGVSDGHLAFLLLVTALFSAGRDYAELILFDEPEISLHPHANVVFAQAVQEACESWNKQVLIATHSPILINQFRAEDLFACSRGDEGQTLVTRVSEMEDMQDYLADYAAGMLYMSDILASQNPAMKKET